MALNDAVPSSATDVFKRNAEDVDRLLNSTGDITTRTGKILPSWDEITQSHAAWNNRGAWATATAYAVNDVWEDGGVWYVVLSAYTSGATAAADIAGPNVAVLNGNFGSAATKDTGTDFDQIPINADIVYPVANVTALRALTGISVGQQFYLEGHTNKGIGGGILLATKTHSTEVDDNGYLFVVDGIVLERQATGIISSNYFGVLTDVVSTSELISASEYAGTRAIYIPSGNYDFGIATDFSGYSYISDGTVISNNSTVIVQTKSRQSSGPNLSERLIQQSMVRGMYYRRGGEGVFMVGFGMSEEDLDNKWVVEYRFQNNGDGLFLLRGGYSGKEDIASIMATTTLNGTFVLSSAPITYTTTVGDKFTASLTGKVLRFKSRLDNRGGIWKVTLSTGEVATVSTYALVTIDGFEQTIFKGLDYRERTVEFEFMGDDPLNAPSGGTSRGWLYYDAGIANEQPILFANVAAIDESTRQDIIASNSVSDFAILCKPSGAAYSSEWVPNHGTLGTTVSINTGISIDGIRISSVVGVTPSAGYDFVECDSFALAQAFNAVNPNGLDGTMWAHTITHTFNSKEPCLTISNGLELGQDVDVQSAYLAMLPSKSQYIDRLVQNNGRAQTSFLADNSNQYTGWNVDSVAFVGEYSAGRGHGVSLSVSSIDEAGSNNKEGQPDSLIRFWDRTDGIIKLYFTASEGGIWRAGRKLTCSSKYTLISGVRSPANGLSMINGY